ncbi:MAG: hypothetical protein RMI34_03305 [Chloroherpetonaceae bacterium]|nr:hypothetical protein [Chloroherpetonaceae bacterium]MCS7212400.1 hypothetical protein [Chloroherpetonaceae bacterium]MDW8019086.1 hypothetical protein [Chloroherpetonaceae bacterium]MDW8465554.1 hypothetical protein [Chloroherpetonaceae bacterium]
MIRILLFFAIGFALYYVLRFLYVRLSAPKHVKPPYQRPLRFDEIEDAEFKEIQSTPKSKSSRA